MVKVRTYELEHWVLFDTLKDDQITRLKHIIDTKTEPATARARGASAAASSGSNGSSFQSMLMAETAKLDRMG